MTISQKTLEQICKRIRYEIITSTSKAKSGHPTSSLSAVELMASLFFSGFFRAKLDDPSYINNDRLIFSKGHASPLFYALYALAGKVSHQEMLRLREFDSSLEGHPTMRFPFTEAATGSLGQGLSIGVGMALNAKMDKLPYRTFVLLGDSEMAEGSNWEALQIASYYKLDNLIGILDVNRLGQRGETMLGHDIETYERRIQAFGWKTYLLHEGHHLTQIYNAFEFALNTSDQPTMIIAKTLKGKGFEIWEDKEFWHSKQLSENQLETAVQSLGIFDKEITANVSDPEQISIVQDEKEGHFSIEFEERPYSTKEASGMAVKALGSMLPEIVVLDAEVSNSTHSELFQKEFPKRFFEMFIAEQNMVGAALGFSRRKKIPFVFTFSAFLTRAFDQIRMSQYSDPNIKFIGSYAGVSLGKDGSSQMGLEDIAMFNSVQNTTILYPSDAYSTSQLVRLAAEIDGNVYIRTAREPVAHLYSKTDAFFIGGSQTLKSSGNDKLTILAAGITVHEALKAYDLLKANGITVRVIDLYSIAPLDMQALQKAAEETTQFLVVEDHVRGGGLAQIVALAVPGYSVHSLAVAKMPCSGQPTELLKHEEIDADAIFKKVTELVK